ncbi:AraC family transcriptional regulator [Frankia sp. Cas4]|uniref:AraC family transcriptional regulator n=1 Tax=Frankia sp. Cas4 TaxID=3073927 RepID=UPI002AD2B43C|nr:AraC family transcriptional regulator [Frankia sp. Cas4]
MGEVQPMVRAVERDARGIIAPDVGLTRFRLDRYPPSAQVARFVDRYWVATWDLTGQDPFTQRVFAHPVVNAVLADGAFTVHGVTTRIGARTLSGAGRALGIMFRPAGFRPFAGGSMAKLRDRTLPFADVFGADAVALLAHEVTAAADPVGMAAAADRFLDSQMPSQVWESEATSALVEKVAADPTFVRVDALAALCALTPRQLQRRFADHVGIGPKATIRRYRFYEAAERARGADVDWADLAAELGYSDQAHLTREFSAIVGLPPSRYARACRAG